MSNYETIKEVAMQLMQRKKMASLYYAKEDYENYNKQVLPLMADALNLIEQYPSDFAVYVVAFNVISSSVKGLCDLTDKFQDTFSIHAIIALENQAQLLEKSVLFLGRNINREEAANFLVQESMTLFHVIITIHQYLDKSHEVARQGLDECIDGMLSVCANLYKIVQSFHSSLEVNKNLYAFLEQLLDDPRECISKEKSLRPAQIKEIYKMIADYAKTTFDEMSSLFDSVSEGPVNCDEQNNDKKGYEFVDDPDYVNYVNNLRRGDIYNIDGVDGIVLNYNPETGEGKLVSHKRILNTWEDPSFDGIWKMLQSKTPATMNSDGRVNCAEIQKTKGWDWKYPCVWWCKNLGKDWYLPSLEEFDKDFYSNEVQIHYSPIDVGLQDFPPYWTSKTIIKNHNEAFVAAGCGIGYAASRKSKHYLVAMRYFKK